MSDTPQAKYAVSFTIHIQRADKQILTDDENAMTEEMRAAVQNAIEAVMVKHGQRALAQFGKKVVY
jgi:hypothetical protein